MNNREMRNWAYGTAADFSYLHGVSTTSKILNLLERLDVSATKVRLLLKSHIIHSPVELKKATTYLEKLVIELLRMLG